MAVFSFKRLAAAALLAVALLPAPILAKTKATATQPATGGQVTQYETESAAQARCRADTVVWLNTKTGIYHEKGMRWYGKTKQGAYVCRKEADAAGDRDTRNGQ